MSVTILEQPAEIAFSRNPMLFRLKTDALRATAGIKYIGRLSPIAFVGTFKFTLKYNGLSLDFVLSDNPDTSGYQLRSLPAGISALDTVKQLAEDLSHNFYLDRDFVITATAQPYEGVLFTARKTGEAYNLALSDYENVSISQDQAGVTETFQPNFKLYTELWAQNADHSEFVKVSDAFLEVDDNGEAAIDLSEPLTNVLLADSYDRPNVRFAVATADQKSCRQYYLVIAEAYGTTQVIRKTQKTAVKTALLGGISKEKLEEFAFPDSFISSGLLKFLKQEPQTVSIRPEQQEFLTLVTFNQGFNKLQLVFKIYFTDNTTVSRNGDYFSAVQRYQKFTWPAGYEQNHFQLVDGTRIIQKYEVTVVDENGNAVSETKTYLLDYNYRPYTRFFLYLSSFGTYDTKLTYGKSSNQYQIVTSTANRTLQGQFHLVDGEQIDYSVTLNNTETYTTGYRKISEIRSFRDLFLSLDKVLIRKGRAYPMVFASDKINEYKDGENLHALTFEMGYRFKEQLWTYDDKDDIPAGLYLNMPGSGNTTLPMPILPENYFDYRYYLKSETYNKAEIDAKIASVTALINMNANATNGTVSQLSLSLSNAVSNFNTALSSYYTQAQINTILQQISGSPGAAKPPIEIKDDITNKRIIWDDDAKATYGPDPTLLLYYLSYYETATQLYTGRFVQPQITKSGGLYSVFLDWDDHLNGNLILI